jgi:hypothetical protein
MIYCEDEGVDEFYIGSSVDLKSRIRTHRFACNNITSKDYNMKVYNYIRNNFGFENFTVKTIQRFPCENEKELHQREQEWIDELKPTLNNQRAIRTKEYTRLYQNSKHREQYIKHKEKINEKASEVIQCDNCDKTYTKRNKATHQKSKYCINYNSNKSV